MTIAIAKLRLFKWQAEVTYGSVVYYFYARTEASLKRKVREYFDDPSIV